MEKFVITILSLSILILTNASVCDRNSSIWKLPPHTNNICQKEMRNPYWINQSYSAEVRCPKTEASYYIQWSCHDRQDQESYFQMNEDYELFTKFNATQFLYGLKQHAATLIFVGDSISQEMYYNLACIVESDEESLLPAFHETVFYFRSNLLTTINPKYYIYDIANNATEIQNDEWIRSIESLSSKNKIVVINVGAWFLPERIWHKNSTTFIRPDTNEVIAVYESHFVEDSPLSNALQHLMNNHGVTVIWRDTTPGGICGDKGELITSWTHYYKYFHEFNIIAKSFVQRIGGFHLPLIWEASKSRWKTHIMGEKNDFLHYCLFKSSTVPWMWDTVLFNYLEKKIYKESCLKWI